MKTSASPKEIKRTARSGDTIQDVLDARAQGKKLNTPQEKMFQAWWDLQEESTFFLVVMHKTRTYMVINAYVNPEPGIMRSLAPILEKAFPYDPEWGGVRVKKTYEEGVGVKIEKALKQILFPAGKVSLIGMWLN